MQVGHRRGRLATEDRVQGIEDDLAAIQGTVRTRLPY